MDIQQKNIDALNAELVISLKKDDYTPQWNKAMRTHSQQLTLPGFRKGHIPLGLVKKQYGKALLAEEMNKIINAALQEHITKNELNVLGNPLPKEDDDAGDWENPNDFTFTYELGLAPDFKLDLGKKTKFEKLKVKVDGKLVEQQAKDLARRYGKMSEPETAGDQDLLMVTLIELDGKDIKEGGIMNDSTISLEFVKDKATKKKLVGAKVEDTIDVDLEKLSENHDDLGRLLGIDHAGVHDLASTVFRARVNEVKRLEPAELNQELFDKLYGEGNVTDQKAFNERVKADLEKTFERDANNLFRRSVSDTVVDTINPDLPDNFMKRWIEMSNDKPISKEELDKEYPMYARGLKWQLIQNKVLKEKEIKVSNEEIEEQAQQEVKQQYAQYGLNLEGEQLQAMAQQALGDQEQIRRIYDYLYEMKTVDALSEMAKIEEKEVSYDKFVEIANALN